MTERDLDTLARVLAQFRRDELLPLQKRVEAIEQRQGLEARLAELEMRVRAETLDLPNWRACGPPQ
jgi:hypothetical protein